MVPLMFDDFVKPFQINLDEVLTSSDFWLLDFYIHIDYILLYCLILNVCISDSHLPLDAS